ncbi:putative holin-like toxin [Tumebacillus flagellatus]|nr:putative holin-like toxin [Tumebacillus flagellatus]
MSTHDVVSLMLQFGLFLLAGLTLIVTIIKYWFDMHNKQK